MDSAILVALIVSGGTLIGTIISAKFVSNVEVIKLKMKMDEVEAKVTKHNSLIERQYKTEARVQVIENKIEGLKFEYNGGI